MTPHASRIVPVLPLLAAALASGCGPAARDIDAESRLAGTWAVSLRVDAALPAPYAEPGDLAGTLVLAAPPPSVARGTDRPPHCGARISVAPGKLADLLHEMGCGLRVHAASDDALELTVGDRGELQLAGHADGDSFVGRWWYGGRSAGASGRFVLRREASPSQSLSTADSSPNDSEHVR